MNDQNRRVLSEARFHRPGAVAEASAARKVRDGWGSDRLLIVAADHPARGIIEVGDILKQYAPDAVVLQGPHATIRWPGGSR